MRENTAELLELSGYEVTSCENGKNGVEFARELRPDLIVCDIMLPGLDGYGVLHLLSNDSDKVQIPFIFLTAKTEKRDMRKGMELGADDFITKPFQDIDLLNAIESRLKKRKMLDESSDKGSESLLSLLSDAGQALKMQHLSEDYIVQQHKKKEIIYREGDHANYLYYVKYGQIKTYRISDDGKELITGIYMAGDFFGYRPILTETIHDAYAEILEDSELYKLKRTQFYDLIHKDNTVATKFIKLLSKNLSEKEKELIELAYSSVRKRVANKLLELSKKSNDQVVTITRTNLARLVGTSKETLVRTLTEFKEDGIINTDGSDVEILNSKKLSSLVKNW